METLPVISLEAKTCHSDFCTSQAPSTTHVLPLGEVQSQKLLSPPNSLPFLLLCVLHVQVLCKKLKHFRMSLCAYICIGSTVFTLH